MRAPRAKTIIWPSGRGNPETIHAPARMAKIVGLGGELVGRGYRISF